MRGQGSAASVSTRLGRLGIKADVPTPQVCLQFEREYPVVLDIQVGGETITCTPEHPFWVPGQGWQPAGELKVGTQLLTRDGKTVPNTVQLEKKAGTIAFVVSAVFALSAYYKPELISKRIETVPINAIESRAGEFTIYNIEVEELHTYYVSSFGILVHNTCNEWGDDVEKIPLWRAVKDPELGDITKTGMFRTSHPGWGEVKYFSEAPEGAASYAKQAYEAWPNEDPYTMVETSIPKEFITPDMLVPVDGNVDAVVIPEDLLPYLNPPTALDYMPITGLRQ